MVRDIKSIKSDIEHRKRHSPSLKTLELSSLFTELQYAEEIERLTDIIWDWENKYDKLADKFCVLQFEEAVRLRNEERG